MTTTECSVSAIIMLLCDKEKRDGRFESKGSFNGNDCT